jgi:D-3-phosphoglycerate dehydrogenase
MLTFARKMTRLDRDIRQGRWEKPRLMALGECVLGIVGVGDCGKAVVRRAVSFGMRVLGNDIVELPADFVNATGLEVVSLEKLLATSDFVSLHTDLNDTSYHLIGKAQLEQMKAGAYLINTSRGPVVNEPDLIDALQQGIIAGAALDVFEDEPLPADSPLRDLDNCLLAPHTANSSPKAWERVHESTVRNLLEVLHNTGT